MISTKLSLAALGCAASLMAAVPAGAVTYTLQVTAINGALAGQSATGTITWDQTLVPTSGTASLSKTGGAFGSIADPTLALMLTAGPEVFTEADDLGAPDYPIFAFFNGDLVAIDYSVTDASTSADLSAYGVTGFSVDFFGGTTLSANGVTATARVNYISVAPVPLPAGLPLMAGAMGLLALARRRRT